MTQDLTMESPLKREFEYFLSHQDELLKKYNGKVIVLKNCTVIGTYETEAQAVAETSKTHALGTFLVQKVEPGADAYTQTFHSRVAFAR